MKNLQILMFIFLMSNIYGNNLPEIMNILKRVETNYNTGAIGDGGDSWGILQIQMGVIKDINKKYGTSYTHEDAFDEACSEEIFELYIKLWTEKLEKRHNRGATPEDIVRIWNGGPRGYQRGGTLGYLAKYYKFKEMLEMNKRKCMVNKKLGIITATYTYTYDVYMFKSKTTLHGVSRKVVNILPKKIPKTKMNQLKLIL